MSKFACPVCHAESRPRNRWYLECECCELVFSRRMELPDTTARAFFDRAYLGKLPGEFGHFSMRLQMAGVLGELGDGFPAAQRQEVSIQVLRERLPPGARVLDIGCGIGMFLRRLRAVGFHPSGLDVAEATMNMLQDEGFEVWHGEVESYPEDRPQPEACTLNLVLHHSPNPIGFLASIRKRFPHSMLFVSDIEASKPLYPGWKPPRHLTVWTARSMEIALQKAGYSVRQIWQFPVEIRSLGDSVGWRLFLALPPPLRQVALLRAYYGFKPFVTAPLWAAMRVLGMNGNVSAVATPISREDSPSPSR